MDLPSHITDEIFEKEFKRGAILSTEMVFSKTGERKREYIIILNQNPAEAETLLFLTTSKTAYYDKHPTADHIRIAVGTLPSFPLETIINCQEVFAISRSELKSRFRSNVLRFSGNLPPETMGRIDQIVRASRMISPRHKKAILGWS